MAFTYRLGTLVVSLVTILLVLLYLSITEVGDILPIQVGSWHVNIPQGT